MHQSGGFDPATGQAPSTSTRRWTAVFSDEIVRIGEERDDIVAVTAAMCEPTGLGPFARRFPNRAFDVGIAEQHAVTSAAGLAMGGLHPVVAVYATFLNRAFDQLLLDVALHRLPVTLVLDRAGITGEDGPSHNGIWDMALAGIVPGLRVAAPRDEPTLRAQLREAVEWVDGPTVVRYPKTPLGEDVPAVRSSGGVDVLFEPSADAAVDLLVVSVGAMAAEALNAVQRVAAAGFTVRVVDPRWIEPVSPELIALARHARVVVTVEDGVAVGGVGARLSQALRAAGCDVPIRELGVPTRFLQHGKVPEVKAAIGLTAADLGRRMVEWTAELNSPVEAGADLSDERLD
jgi:1-deoxy-D-xylulose-5-phosphate synthase